jgi:hypothetical protein
MKFDELKTNEEALWSLLLYAGYLKSIKGVPDRTKYRCDLSIPNREVLYVYQDVFVEWFSQATKGRYHSLLSSITAGDVEKFIKELDDFLFEAVSFRDFTDESHYHTFILGLTCSLCDTHELDSNKEYGLGYPDFVLIPKSTENQLGIILEFKHVKLDRVSGESASKNKELTKAERQKKLKIDAKKGLEQINLRLVPAGFNQYAHVKQVLKIGLSFLGKSVGACCQRQDLSDKTNSEIVYVIPEH